EEGPTCGTGHAGDPTVLRGRRLTDRAGCGSRVRERLHRGRRRGSRYGGRVAGSGPPRRTADRRRTHDRGRRGGTFTERVTAPSCHQQASEGQACAHVAGKKRKLLSPKKQERPPRPHPRPTDWGAVGGT